MSDDAASAAKGSVRPPGDLNPRRDPVLDFPDLSLRRMSPADYAELGFLSGLEVHQQVLTSSKLFCRCPAGRKVERVDAEVLRHMRPTLSELGEYDGTALMEFKTRKEIVYLLERGTVCTYEMDDTPPFEIDPAAIRVAIELALLCNLNLVSELHVMRKQYLDGSIPTGFQRTAMVGLTGAIPFRAPELGVDRELRIRQLSLEEDSCREVSDLGHRVTFRTDRLGTPLTEVVTEPDLLTPLELQAAGRLIAAIAHATGKVRRGPGAARQDVNVSVAGGRRIEIKGVPHHRGLPLLVHNEAFRQLNLLRVRAELHRRELDPSVLLLPDRGMPWDVSPLVMDAGGVLARTGHGPLRQSLERGETVCAIRLPGFGGILDHPTQPGLTFALELAERVRVIACPPHRPFMTHSGNGDSVLSQRHWQQLGRALGAGSDDALVVVWAARDDAATAAREILIRAAEAFVGVPAETRQALRDGTTGFERILPGPDRMYPDTDTPPLPIADDVVAEIVAGMGEAPWTRQARYGRLGLDERSARRMVAAGWAELFDELAPAPGPPARRVATALEQRIPFHARRRGAAAGHWLPPAARLQPLVRALEAGELLPSALVMALDDVLAVPDRPVAEVLAVYQPIAALDGGGGDDGGDGGGDDGGDDSGGGGPADTIRAVAARSHLLRSSDPEAVLRWAMGEVLRRWRGRLDPTAVERRLRQELTDVASPAGAVAPAARVAS
jgi:glutamyl-tRNA(Gln) amidotransferase subunit E